MKEKQKSRNLRRMFLMLIVTLLLSVSVSAAPQKETGAARQTRASVTKQKNKITASSTSVYLGKTKSLNAKALGGTLKYKSSNTKIVSVNTKGVLKGLKTGSAVITISTNGNAKYQGTSKKITVKVVKKKGIPSDKLKYKYEVKFFNQPYDDRGLAYFIKTNNPNPDSFEVVFYDPTGNAIQYYVSTSDTFFDIYYSKKMDRYYKTKGGYIQAASLGRRNRPGIYNIAIREKESLKQAYMGKIRIKNEKQDRLQWMKEVIAKVTTPSMTKPEKMSAISNYLYENSRYLDNYMDSNGIMKLYDTIVDYGSTYYKTYKWDSLISPFMLEQFGELIGYPLDSLYDNYPMGSEEWASCHWFAQSKEDGKLYECCPMVGTGTSSIRRPEDYPQLNCLTYKGYYEFR